nr:MAG TPA: hypothetical protein [Caudoviricetes sp.]
MAKNLIPEIAKMLGVELGEKFKIEGREYIFHFVDNGLNGLVACRTDGSELPRENCLAHFLWLINGEEEIVKLPWKPKEGDTVYSFDIRYGKWVVCSYMWAGVPCDYALLDKGWIFRTKEEAKAALPKVAAELGVDYEL